MMEYNPATIRNGPVHSPGHQTKTPRLSQPVSPIRKLAQASYPHPSEGRQDANHSHRKPTKMITWTVALCHSMKLRAVLCRAAQEGWVMVESSDKMWPTGEGNDTELLHSSALRTP